MRKYVGRLRVLVVLSLLACVVIIGRLYFLQIVHGQEYIRRADAQTVNLYDPLLNRGSIYFSDKDGTQILAAGLRDVASSSEHQRYYPGGSLAAQELGFVAYNSDDEQKGRYGLERYYESTLSRGGEDLYQNFFVQLFGASGSSTSDFEQGDIITTIEPSVQAELERTLQDYDVQWHPALAGGIIMDPTNGEIVGMAVSPTFDLNKFNEQTDPAIYANPLAEGTFEMGSIIKPLTMAAGLDSGSVTPETTYN
ncbi:MAG: hypothetical protein KGI70_02855, partial [Patescibacteria group bacterium]|nr:hypothetical protein [Patescibacteria group bacterium]